MFDHCEVVRIVVVVPALYDAVAGHAFKAVANQIYRVVGIMPNASGHGGAGLDGPDGLGQARKVVMQGANERSVDVAAQDEIDAGFGPLADGALVAAQEVFLVDSVGDVHGLMGYDYAQLLVAGLPQALGDAFDLSGRDFAFDMPIAARCSYADD